MCQDHILQDGDTFVCSRKATIYLPATFRQPGSLCRHETWRSRPTEQLLPGLARKGVFPPWQIQPWSGSHCHSRSSSILLGREFTFRRNTPGSGGRNFLRQRRTRQPPLLSHYRRVYLITLANNTVPLTRTSSASVDRVRTLGTMPDGIEPRISRSTSLR